MKSLRFAMFSATFAALILGGCGDDAPMMVVPDAMPDGPGTPPPPDAMPMPDRMPPTGGDGNDSFDDAVEIEVDGMMGAGGAIGTPRDHDFFSFTGTADSWVLIDIDANPDDDTTKVDTVIRLYDSSMTVIAENDDGVPRINTDSEIITRLPSGGTYYIEVLEFSEWADSDDPEGDPSYAYEVSVTAIDPRADAVTIETESGDDDASAQPLAVSSMGLSYLLGTLEDGTDQDVFSFTIPEGASANFSAQIMPSGATGYGSTASAGAIEVVSADGTDVITRIDQSLGQDDNSPNLAPGDYLLRVNHSGGRIGTNDFYVFKLSAGGDNSPETAEEANNAVAGAEAVVVEPRGTGRSGFVLATLGTNDDVDHFSLGPAPGEALSVACGSESHGTGVRGLEVTVLGADGTTVLMTATETPTEGIYMRDLTIPAMTDTIYVRLQKMGQAAGISEDTVRCGFHFGTPRM